eukprot:TRINITY_DN16811_c0_g1_i1.p1 TRINITY_DN16811_c0_g1~~TRINITY_DN16811_c0_g1_i1.p1  ORF type:complete len:2351 (+),score=235.87 TRINITY_DN16811_c0_g1_i1:1056-7055(+)
MAFAGTDCIRVATTFGMEVGQWYRLEAADGTFHEVQQIREIRGQSVCFMNEIQHTYPPRSNLSQTSEPPSTTPTTTTTTIRRVTPPPTPSTTPESGFINVVVTNAGDPGENCVEVSTAYALHRGDRVRIEAPDGTQEHVEVFSISGPEVCFVDPLRNPAPMRSRIVIAPRTTVPPVPFSSTTEAPWATPTTVTTTLYVEEADGDIDVILTRPAEAGDRTIHVSTSYGFEPAMQVHLTCLPSGEEITDVIASVNGPRVQLINPMPQGCEINTVVRVSPGRPEPVNCDASAAPVNGAVGTCSQFLSEGHTCQPRCNTGYVVSGVSSCNFGTLVPATCRPASCSQLTAPLHGSLGNCPSVLQHGESCQMRCDGGYEIHGTTSCSNGELASQYCGEGDCQVSAPENGAVGDCPSILSHGQTCSPTCGNGWVFRGLWLCNNGQMIAANAGQSGRCERTGCLLESPPAHLSIASCPQNLEEGTSCEVTCARGFQNDISILLCSHGTLNWDEVQCRAAACDASAPPRYGQSGTCGPNLASGDSCEIICNTGYLVSGSTRCNSGIIEAARCTPSVCEMSRDPLNADMGDCDWTMQPGQSCSPACHQGYTLTSELRCNNGRFSGGICSPRACEGIEAPENGNLGTCSVQLPSGSTCAFSCFQGFYPSGQVECRAGQLHPARCVARPCDITPPMHGTRGNCPASIVDGETCQPACNVGYEVDGLSSCNSGILTPANCRPSGCAIATAPENGLPGQCGGMALNSGESCIPECNTGYEVVGATRCHLGRIESAVCEGASCDASAVGNHATAGNCTSRLRHNHQCRPACIRGYTVSGNTLCEMGVITQQASCQPAACRPRPAPLNGNVGNCPASMAHGESCDFGCADGFTIAGRVTCDHGEFTRPTCNPNPCVPPNPPEHGRAGTCTQTLQHNQRCQIECDNGYTASGPSVCAAGVVNNVTCSPSPCTVPEPANGFRGACARVLNDGQSCTPVCSAGFQVHGENICRLGVLSPAECRPASCDSSRPPTNGLIGDCAAALPDGQACTPICNLGYIARPPQSTCLRGVLNATRCIARPCDASDPPLNGAVGSCTADMPSDSYCVPACNDGYTLSKRSYCLRGDLDRGVCEPGKCDVSTPPGNGTLGSCNSTAGLELASGGTCVPHCNAGYTPSGTTSCHLGVLVSNTTCRANPCTFSEAPLHGRWGNCAAQMDDSTTCEPACNEGYSLDKPTSCVAGMIYPSVCEPRACNTGGPPENGRVGTCSVLLPSGERCQPTCNQGYEASGPSICEFGVFTAAHCRPAGCRPEVPAPNNGQHGECSAHMLLNHSESCRPECNAGYTLVEPTKCVLGQIVVGVCKEHACRTPTQPLNGQEGACNRPLESGQTCTPRCNPGYMVQEITSCRAGTLKIAICAPNSCDASRPPENGEVGNCQNPLLSGGNCQPSCDSGYTVSGFTSCHAGNLIPATCRPNRCIVPAPPNGTRGNCHETLRHGQTCKPVCIPGFEPSGENSCSLGRLIAATCNPKRCEINGGPENGDMGTCADRISHGSTCMPQCKSGFTRVGVYACNMGVLTERATCVAKECGRPPQPLNGLVGACDRDLNDGDSCLPVCNAGYELLWPFRCEGGKLREAYCTPRRCARTTAPANSESGNCEDNMPSGSSCYPKCAHGYTLTSSSRCDLGVWTAGNCTTANCDASLAPLNGRVGTCTSDLPTGSHCNVACDTGFTPSGRTQCTGGMLESAVCGPSKCRADIDPPNGHAGDCPDWLDNRGSCQQRCFAGYVVTGRATCMDGTLRTARCDPAPCYADNWAPKNGVAHDCDVAYLPSGSTCQPKCNVGFDLVGVTNCSMGRISHAVCAPADCKITSAPANGAYGACNAILRHGSRCTPYCHIGYTRHGQFECENGVLRTAICTIDTVWSCATSEIGDIYYTGYDAMTIVGSSDGQGRYKDGVRSSWDCGNLCAKINERYFYSYRLRDGRCWCKTSRVGEDKQEGYVSGESCIGRTRDFVQPAGSQSR